MNDATNSSPWTAWILRVQWALLAVLLLGLIGVRFSVLPFGTAFKGFGLALVGMSALGALAVLALLISWFRGAAHWRAPALRAAVVGFIPALVIMLIVGPAGFKVPAIHDISTDTQDPPEFVAAKQERSATENTLVYGGPELARQQRQAYPDLQALRLNISTDVAFARAQAVCQQFGWRIIRTDAADGVVEAVEETLVFGFKDDVIIRVLPTEEGSQIDVRSVSRVGISDLGANAKRIRRVLAAFQEG